jgi:hypothetical protein
VKAARRVLWCAVWLAGTAVSPVHAQSRDLSCTMIFQLKTWSALYKSATGSGTVHCSNGHSMRVKLSATGGGLTAGRSQESGRGKFSGVSRMDELLGAYAQAEAHAGAVHSVQAQVMTKGEVSLALTGKGRGWSLGVDVGELRIER